MSHYIDIILFAILAVFLFFKLRNVIGETDDEIVSQDKPFKENEVNIDNKPNPTQSAHQKNIFGSSAVADAVRGIKAREPDFDVIQFVKSAEAAFKMIVKAYVAGDRKTLRMLLSPEIFKRFEQDIDSRERDGKILEIAIKAIKKIHITDVDVRERFTKIEVTYVVEEVVFTKDLTGAILDGDQMETIVVTDVWTFEKRFDEKDPTWYLVETHSDNDDKP